MVEKFERNAFVRLKANPNYWGSEPAFKSVTIKFVPTLLIVWPKSKAAMHVSVEMPYEEFDRLKVVRVYQAPICRYPMSG